MVARPARCLAALIALAVGACSGEKEEASDPGAGESSSSTSGVEVVGVHPDDFECGSIAPKEDVSAIVGGEVTLAPSKFDPPRGVARPCNYERPRYAGDAGGTLRRWSIDYDCRDSAVGDAERLMAQYASEEEAEAIRIGQSGIDRKPALLFIDDDTPCYVRIVGPSREVRKELARLVASELTEKTAPMTPEYREKGSRAAE